MGNRLRAGLRELPDRRAAAVLAVPDDSVVGGAHVYFDAGIVDFFGGLTPIADKGEHTKLLFGRRERRVGRLPKILRRIEKSDAIGKAAGAHPDLADHADFHFPVALGPPQDKLLLGRELVFGDDAGPVKTQKNGMRRLGEDVTVQIRPDKEDGNFLRDAATSAHTLWWQGKGQMGSKSKTG